MLLPHVTCVQKQILLTRFTILLFEFLYVYTTKDVDKSIICTHRQISRMTEDYVNPYFILVYLEIEIIEKLW